MALFKTRRSFPALRLAAACHLSTRRPERREGPMAGGPALNRTLAIAHHDRIAHVAGLAALHGSLRSTGKTKARS